MAEASSFLPPSLAQLFEAPDGYVGRFGWVCGYSADAGFLNDAAERFTRQTHRQRAYAGRTALLLMLDPGHLAITYLDAPAVLHVPIQNRGRPFRLMHAKVALLGFRHAVEPYKWRLRLIVSTGNWTRETLEDSLDLAWTIELSDHDDGPDLTQRRADFAAAWDILKWLRGQYDCRALRGAEADEVQGWIESAVRESKGTRARVIDNRRASLLDQLPAMIAASGPKVARNYFAMGSGFYEAPTGGNAAPHVPQLIAARLRAASLLTNKSQIDLFINPNACQAVASAAEAIRQLGWSIRKAGKPGYFRGSERALHAKFLFGANRRDNSPRCNSAWIYFGSGNLTAAGFTQRMSANGGNLEAGVIFAPQDLIWHSNNEADATRLVTNLLPLQWDEKYGAGDIGLSAGEGMPDRPDLFVAAPIACFDWQRSVEGGWLVAPMTTDAPFNVLDDAGVSCRREADGRIRWMGDRPRQVNVAWTMDGATHAAWIPVFDEFGRLAGSALPQLGLDEAWSQLACFPMPPDEDELPGDDGFAAIDSTLLRAATGGAQNGDYPIRRMMELIENIAAMQAGLHRADWTAWCVRLEQSLAQAAGNEALKRFCEFGVNPLSPLWQPPFRPEFAETANSPEGRIYEAALTRLEETWGVKRLAPLGALP